MTVGAAPARAAECAHTDGPPSDPGTAVRADGYPIHVDALGQWYYHGSQIQRRELVALFASALRRDAAGDYWLVTPGERGRIVVEDVPFIAVELAVNGRGEDQECWFRTNLDEWVVAGPDNPLRLTIDAVTKEPRPYVMIRDRMEALIARPVFYEMSQHVETQVIDGEEKLGLWSRWNFFVLADLPGD